MPVNGPKIYNSIVKLYVYLIFIHNIENENLKKIHLINQNHWKIKQILLRNSERKNTYNPIFGILKGS